MGASTRWLVDDVGDVDVVDDAGDMDVDDDAGDVDIVDNVGELFRQRHGRGHGPLPRGGRSCHYQRLDVVVDVGWRCEWMPLSTWMRSHC